MRLNKYVAQATGLSRRAADAVIEEGRVAVNGKSAILGLEVTEQDAVTLDGNTVKPSAASLTIMLHKPVGYVCSRAGQGSKTVYDLLPAELHALKPVGRLDKDSSGLLLLTNDGDLAQELTHPSKQKVKVYEIALDKPLEPLHRQMISDFGVQLEDGPSMLQLERSDDTSDREWKVTMHEGRNRQIRRTFASLGYDVVHLHRIQFGNYTLGNLESGQTTEV